MLITNNAVDLYNVSQDAELVHQAALSCELCKDEKYLVELEDQRATEIRAALEELAEELEFNDKVFLWYSGHATSDERGLTRLHAGDDGLCLEDTVYEIFEAKNRSTLTIWCVVAACRDKEPDEVVCQKEYSTRGQSSNTYAFMYACAVGERMLDSSVFARAFCYQLEWEPRTLGGLKFLLEIDCEIITFGDLKVPPIEIVPPYADVKLKLKQRRDQRADPEYNRKWIDLMRPAKLVADHLHYLADEALIFQSGGCSSTSDSGSSSAADSDPYGSYVEVRGIAVEIIKSFHQQAVQFEELHQQLRILRCNTLAEVQQELSASSFSSASDELAQWNPCGDHEWTLDMRVLQNLPDEVIRVIGEAHRTWKEKWKEENETDFPTKPIFELLRMLGCFYTERKFPGTTPTQKCCKVTKCIEDYFKILYIPGASFAHV